MANLFGGDGEHFGVVSAAKSRRQRKAVLAERCVSEAIGSLGVGESVFAITRGQFSMIDVIRHLVGLCGEGCAVSVWTWTVADYEVEAFEWFFRTNQVGSARLVIDRSAEKRNEGLIERWREVHGVEQVRVCMNHAKIATVEGGGLRFLARGSMNLNYNPRFEQLDVSEGGPEFALIRDVELSLPVLPRRCSRKQADDASGLRNSFSANVLKEFSGVKTWAK